MAGDILTGVGVMRLTEGLDEGPTLAVERLRIGALDTAGTVHDRLAEVSQPAVRTLFDIADGCRRTPQPAEGVTYARKIRPRETRIDGRKPAAEVDCRIRGLRPHPGPGSRPGESADRCGYLGGAAVARRRGRRRPGAVLDDRLLIACGTGAVRLLAAQREGRGAQQLDEFARGFRVEEIVV